jgi:dihydrolipoamide dehydrogenase
MYDLVIIGAGWAGFNAALRAKELGLSVCLIDANQLGGTCLNYGCIPTKTLITSAKIFSTAKKSSNFGIELDHLCLNWPAIQAKKDKVVLALKVGMQSRLKGIDFINSSARIVSATELKVDDRLIKAKFILVATGSKPTQLAQLKFGQSNIISSDQALVLSEIPPSLLIVGGGVIGCEFAALFCALGSSVTVIEKLPALLPAEDKEISRKLESIFKKKGIKVLTGSDISALDLNDYSKVLVCVGRTPQVNHFGLEEAGVKLDNNRISLDGYLKSSLDNIYAAGDCTGKVMLAHYAAYQGVLAVENMVSSNQRKADNQLVPACIFTDPQIASVGIRENDAVIYPAAIKVHKFDFRANAMAQITEEVEGFIKIITEQATSRIIGASIVGPQASELIATLTMAISCGFSIKQFREIIFAHPTFSESLSEVLKD